MRLAREVAARRMRVAGYTGVAYAALQLYALPFLLVHGPTGWTVNWETFVSVAITLIVSIATIRYYFIPACLLGVEGILRVGMFIWAFYDVATMPGGEPLSASWRWLLGTALALPFAVIWIRGALAAHSLAGRKVVVVDRAT